MTLRRNCVAFADALALIADVTAPARATGTASPLDIDADDIGGVVTSGTEAAPRRGRNAMSAPRPAPQRVEIEPAQGETQRRATLPLSELCPAPNPQSRPRALSQPRFCRASSGRT
jgi:hypothetical protein